MLLFLLFTTRSRRVPSDKRSIAEALLYTSGNGFWAGWNSPTFIPQTTGKQRPGHMNISTYWDFTTLVNFPDGICFRSAAAEKNLPVTFSFTWQVDLVRFWRVRGTRFPAKYNFSTLFLDWLYSQPCLVWSKYCPCFQKRIADWKSPFVGINCVQLLVFCYAKISTVSASA